MSLELQNALNNINSVSGFVVTYSIPEQKFYIANTANYYFAFIFNEPNEYQQLSPKAAYERIRNCHELEYLYIIKHNELITYVKFGDQFCVGDLNGASKLLEEKSFEINLKSLVS